MTIADTIKNGKKKKKCCTLFNNPSNNDQRFSAFIRARVDMFTIVWPPLVNWSVYVLNILTN